MSLTPIIQQKVNAIRKLELADLAYETACKEKYGDFKDDDTLYSEIMGEPWQNYLKAGCSRTMINHNVPKEFDFGELQEAI